MSLKRDVVTVARNLPAIRRERKLMRDAGWPTRDRREKDSSARITYFGNFDSTLSRDVEAAINANTVLPESILQMEGMSGRRYRLFINELVRRTVNPRYLEVGTWAGSTAVSAIYGNKLKVTCIDNWSQFGGPKEKFISNIQSVRTNDVDFRLIESDFRKVDFRNIGVFNIFLFDGPHGEEDQFDGVCLALPALDNEFLLIVDDWNNNDVRSGTLRALIERDLNLQSCITIRTTAFGRYPKTHMQASDWHNGYFIACCTNADAVDH